MVVEYSIGDSYTLCMRTEQVFSSFHNYTDIITFKLVYIKHAAVLSLCVLLWCFIHLNPFLHCFWLDTLVTAPTTSDARPSALGMHGYLLYHKYFSLPNTCLIYQIPSLTLQLWTASSIKIHKEYCRESSLLMRLLQNGEDLDLPWNLLQVTWTTLSLNMALMWRNVLMNYWLFG